MKQEQMVGARLPSRLVRELEFIEEVEQSDRSTTVRWLLARAVHERKFEYYARARKVPAQYDLEDLRRDWLRIAFVVYGGMNRKDWRTVSLDGVDYDAAELARQLAS